MELTYIDDEGRWVNLDSLLKMSGSKKEIKQKLKCVLDSYYVQGNVIEEEDAKKLFELFRNIFETGNSQTLNEEMPDKLFEDFLKRFPLFGLGTAFKKFQTKEDLMEHEERAIINFANKFTTCTLNKHVIEAKTDDKELKNRAADVVNIVRECYIHSHTKSCRKYHTECRFRFAKFPMWKTILTRPMKLTEKAGEDQKHKYSEILKKVNELINDNEVIQTILKEFPKDLDTSKQLYELNRKNRIVRLLNMAGLKSDEEILMYEEALKYSTPGYSLVLERDLDEIFVNSYNPEWARAWNGNTDLQVCLDYFAVITYITEYYCKDDSGLMTKLIEMVKNSECETLKEKMILVMNTFISARQMGECEAYYKIMPDLHLKDSNVATVFAPTSKKELRSKFMIRVDEDEEYNGREKKKILDKDGWFVEKYDVIDKYIRRDKNCKGIDDLCPAQYLKMFLTSYGKKVKKPCVENISDNEEQLQNDFPDGEEQLQNDILNIEELNDIPKKFNDLGREEKFHYVMTESNENPIPLPEYFAIENPFPGEPPFMKKRTKPAALRFHKMKRSVDPAAYFFSEALLYI